MPADASEGLRLLSGPQTGGEDLRSHVSRLGPRPLGGSWLIEALEASGLRGRGGAAFPVGRKWRSVASHGPGAVVIANGSEGEPASAKDRVLLERRPHLVLDGAVLAAETMGATAVTVVVAKPSTSVRAALSRALAERRHAGVDTLRVRVVAIPHRYISGESSAVVNYLNTGTALPTMSPPSPHERGVGGRATLVQNVETLAHVAQIARFGSTWFRTVGTAASPGTMLFTVSGAVRTPCVAEAPFGATLGDVIASAGGATRDPQAVLLGGYFGTWLPTEGNSSLRLDDETLRPIGASVGCGVVSLLPASVCGLRETAAIVGYLADESAGQCGPCVHGLASVSEVLDRLAHGGVRPHDMDRLALWTSEIAGRGACHHPDGALRLLDSAMRTFAGDAAVHISRGPCLGASLPPSMPVPVRRRP